MLIPNVLWCDEGQTIPCPYCGSEDHAPHIFEEFAWVTINIVRCVDCGHRFANPCPTPEAAARHYNSQYLKQSRTALPKSIEDIFDPESIWAPKMRHYAHIMTLLPTLPSKLRILDDGCSWGGLLATVRRHFPEARCTGVDLAAEAIAFAKGIFGIEGMVGTLVDFVRANPAEKFDLVLSSHCLEHSLTLRDSLAAMAAAVAPDGLLFVTLPNHDSFLRKQMGGFSPAIRGGNHYHFFGEEFLCAALEEQGLSVERSFTSSDVSPYRAVMLDRLREAGDPRFGAADPLKAVDADGDGEFLYALARHR